MSDEIKNKIKEIVSDVLEMDSGAITDTLNSETCSDWDSVRHISIIIGIEETFDITFDESDFANLTDFGALCVVVIDKVRLRDQ